LYRRLYLAFPEPPQARDALADLKGAGVPLERVHALARPGVDLSGLPLATQPQTQDRVRWLESLFWYGNLGLFAVAAMGLVLALLNASAAGIAAALAAMLATYAAGRRFAVGLPHAHLDELRVPLEHGEVVLLVDLPLARVREVERLIADRHPEAGVGGVGCAFARLGV
jgi:hypothetical protein